jgi:hypothetical protein
MRSTPGVFHINLVLLLLLMRGPNLDEKQELNRCFTLLGRLPYLLRRQEGGNVIKYQTHQLIAAMKEPTSELNRCFTDSGQIQQK